MQEEFQQHRKAQRCHSPLLWCNDCLKKFNSSMSRDALKREKEHHKAICPKEPSEKNKALRERTYVIDEARYELCKKLGWKQTAASHECDKETGSRECVSQRSWKQIRDTIFPNDTITVDESHELVARVEKRDEKRDVLGAVSRQRFTCSDTDRDQHDLSAASDG
ncbi:hypothetical protein LB504_013134 [Fusarium proliferatum]|nr:hypothetical protein LB504_013134 [Fusarium proliferatum]